jgi:hypothetical protein
MKNVLRDFLSGAMLVGAFMLVLATILGLVITVVWLVDCKWAWYWKALAVSPAFVLTCVALGAEHRRSTGRGKWDQP